MTTKPLLGGNTYNYELSRIRQSCDTIRNSLDRLLDGNLGQNTQLALLAKMAVALATTYDALPKLEEIGKNEKAERTGSE